MSFQENADDDYEMNVDDNYGMNVDDDYEMNVDDDYGMNEGMIEGSDTHTERIHIDELSHGPCGSHNAQLEQRASIAVVSQDKMPRVAYQLGLITKIGSLQQCLPNLPNILDLNLCCSRCD